MKITSKILSIPPYLSASWYDVDSLYQSEDGVLVVALTNGTQVRLEHLSSEVVNAIFAAHACFLEEEAKQEEEDEEEDESKLAGREEIEFTVETPLVFGQTEEDGGQSMKIFMEHDPSRSRGPLLPEAMLQRVSALAKMFLPADMPPLDASHENCRCPFCQIIRALSGLPQPQIEEGVEGGLQPELPFEETAQGESFSVEKDSVGSVQPESKQERQSEKGSNSPWVIKEIEDQVYEVTDRAHPDRVFRVSLATPITCSCGEPNCVHVIAVLKS